MGPRGHGGRKSPHHGNNGWCAMKGGEHAWHAEQSCALLPGTGLRCARPVPARGGKWEALFGASHCWSHPSTLTGPGQGDPGAPKSQESARKPWRVCSPLAAEEQTWRTRGRRLEDGAWFCPRSREEWAPLAPCESFSELTRRLLGCSGQGRSSWGHSL